MSVILRRALQDDLPGIPDIRREEDLVNRVDYLAARWNEWFDNPSFCPYVAESQKKIVSKTSIENLNIHEDETLKSGGMV